MFQKDIKAHIDDYKQFIDYSRIPSLSGEVNEKMRTRWEYSVSLPANNQYRQNLTFKFPWRTKNLPKIKSFESQVELHKWLFFTFGEWQHRRWFPRLYQVAYDTCVVCGILEKKNKMFGKVCIYCNFQLFGNKN
jgi:hypothetical protein